MTTTNTTTTTTTTTTTPSISLTIQEQKQHHRLTLPTSKSDKTKRIKTNLPKFASDHPPPSISKQNRKQTKPNDLKLHTTPAAAVAAPVVSMRKNTKKILVENNNNKNNHTKNNAADNDNDDVELYSDASSSSSTSSFNEFTFNSNIVVLTPVGSLTGNGGGSGGSGSGSGGGGGCGGNASGLAAKYRRYGFDQLQPIGIRVLNRRLIPTLKLINIGLLLSNGSFLCWIIWKRLYCDPSEQILEQFTIFSLALYSFTWMRYAGKLLYKLLCTSDANDQQKSLPHPLPSPPPKHSMNSFFAYQLIGTLYLLTELVLLSYYFIVALPPGGAVHNWESVTLYLLSVHRFAAIWLVMKIFDYEQIEYWQIGTPSKSKNVATDKSNSDNSKKDNNNNNGGNGVRGGGGGGSNGNVTGNPLNKNNNNNKNNKNNSSNKNKVKSDKNDKSHSQNQNQNNKKHKSLSSNKKDKKD